MTFHVGQKVVCVDDAGRPGEGATRWYPGSAINVGGVYTVREVGIAVDGRVGLRLHERVLNGERVRGRHAPFRDNFYGGWRFRPVVERKTSIATFQRIRRDVEQGVTHEFEDA